MSEEYVRNGVAREGLITKAVYEVVSREEGFCQIKDAEGVVRNMSSFGFTAWVPASGDWVTDRWGSVRCLGAARDNGFVLLKDGHPVSEGEFWIPASALSGDRRSWKPVLGVAPLRSGPKATAKEKCVTKGKDVGDYVRVIQPASRCCGFILNASKHYVRYLPLHPHTLVTDAVYEAVAIEGAWGLDYLEILGGDGKSICRYHKSAFENPWVPKTGDWVHDGDFKPHLVGRAFGDGFELFLAGKLVLDLNNGKPFCAHIVEGCWKPVLGVAPSQQMAVIKLNPGEKLLVGPYPLALDTPIGPSAPVCKSVVPSQYPMAPHPPLDRAYLRPLQEPLYYDSDVRQEPSSALPHATRENAEVTYGSCACCGEGEPGRKRKLTDGLCAYCHSRHERAMARSRAYCEAANLEAVECAGRPNGAGAVVFKYKSDLASYRKLTSEPEKKP